MGGVGSDDGGDGRGRRAAHGGRARPARRDERRGCPVRRDRRQPARRRRPCRGPGGGAVCGPAHRRRPGPSGPAQRGSRGPRPGRGLGLGAPAGGAVRRPRALRARDVLRRPAPVGGGRPGHRAGGGRRAAHRRPATGGTGRHRVTLRHTGRVPASDLTSLLASPPDLPVAEGLDRLVAAVRHHGSAVLTSPPGSGKTTLVPPALTVALGGRVVVTQPRRIAARAAARRLATLLGEPVGATSGFAVRGDRRSGPGTLVEFVTAGTLLRRVQSDPELPGVCAVVLDEVHERQVDTDLLLAMLVEVRSALREDLAVVAMSATVEADRVAALLGGTEGVVTVPGALHPVATVWCPPPRTAPRLVAGGTSTAFLGHVAEVTVRAVTEHEGDVLVFLPGAREVDDVVRRLRGALPEVAVLPLHGRLSGAEQDRALQSAPGRRVVVSTAVAESSLTVPGVRVVVDSGLAREPRTDHQRGLAGLVTRSVSQAAAEQRAGRAGRQGPGTVYRCWSAAEHARLARHPQPEIHTADLTGPLLERAVWGAPGGAGLALLDPPPPAAVSAAHTTLAELGALTPDGRVTGRGRDIAALGTDPRLARALLDGAALVGRRTAAEVVALLADDGGPGDVDLTAVLRRRRAQAGRGDTWRREADRWERLLRTTRPAPPHEPVADLDLAVGLVTALAHPDRIARRRTGSEHYLLASGAGARFAGGALAGSEWLAVAEATRAPGQADAVIRAAAPIDAATPREAGANLLATVEDVAWRDGRLGARPVGRLGGKQARG